MPSPRSLAALGTLIAPALAQTTSITSLLLYGLEDNTIMLASVISTVPGGAVYSINCPAGTDSNDCGLGDGMIWTGGPSTLGWHSTSSSVSVDLDCTIQSNAATCTETINGDAYGTGTTSVVLSDVSDSLTPLTITAGLEKLSDVSATATASSTSTGASAEATTGASATGSAATQTQTASGTSAASSAAATGAAHRMGVDSVVVGLAGVVGMLLAV